MSATVAHFQASLLALPEGDRAELAHLLLESLGMRDVGAGALEKELARRAEEIRNGRVTGVSAEELFARVDARLAQGR
jgi:putative addiction module component (TIGR02574 family)